MAFRLAATTRYPGHSIEGIDRPDQDPQGSGAWVKGAKVDGVDTISAQPIELMNFPATFPRFVQHALWAFCAQDGLNVCNGNQVEDSRACENASCPVFESCARVPLRPGRLSAAEAA